MRGSAKALTTMLIFLIFIGFIIALFVLYPYRFESIKAGGMKGTKVINVETDDEGNPTEITLETSVSWPEGQYVEDSGWDWWWNEKTVRYSSALSDHPDLQEYYEEGYEPDKIWRMRLSFTYTLSGGGSGKITVWVLGHWVDQINIDGNTYSQANYDLSASMGDIDVDMNTVLYVDFKLEAGAPAFGSNRLEVRDIKLTFYIKLVPSNTANGSISWPNPPPELMRKEPLFWTLMIAGSLGIVALARWLWRKIGR